MEGRALRLLVASLLAAIVLFWALKPKRGHVAVTQAGVLPHGIDARAEGVRLLEAGPQGSLSLRSEDADFSRESGDVHMNGVDIRVQSADTHAGAAGSGHITGDSADASTTGQQFKLSGRVVAETFDGYRLQTSDVRYDHETRMAETDQPVDLDGPGLSVSGQGAQVDFEDQTVEIKGRVHAHLVPQVLQQHVPGPPSLEGPP